MNVTLLSSEQAQTLITGLRRHATLAANLTALLSDEYHAIKNGDAAAMERLSRAKLEVLAKLEQNEELRRQFFRRVAPDVDSTQLDAVTDRVPGAERERYRDVLASVTLALRACAQQNQINGATIGVVKRFTQELIAHMQGDPSTENADVTYGRNGQSAAAVTSNGLVRA